MERAEEQQEQVEEQQEQVEEQEEQPLDGVRSAGGPASAGHVAGSGTPGREPAEEDAAGPVEHDLDELVARAGKADEYLALAQRTQADFENFRKRMARDVAAAEGRGIGRLAKELLPALDNLGRALAAAESGPAHPGEEEPEHHLTSGIRLVHDELLAALHRVGIQPFDPKGEPFDPQLHEAMAQRPVEGAEPGTVVEVYEQGFRLGEGVLRPARVVVAA